MDANRQPLVSVVMPTYNGEKFVIESIKSVLAQTHQNWELIISDDASTDNTEKICLAYQSDPRMKYIHHDKNQGAHINQKIAIQESRGDYIVILAQDDLLEKKFMEETVGYMQSHPECVIVTGDFEAIDELGNRIRMEDLIKIREEIRWEERICEFFKFPQGRTGLAILGLIRASQAKATFFNIKYLKKRMGGSEMIQLPHFAVLGEIISLPKVLKKQRCHTNSMYNSEFNKIKAKPFIERKFIRLKDIYLIRFEQLKVLLASNLPISQKIYIITSVYGRYLKEFLMRLTRAPKKIYSLLR